MHLPQEDIGAVGGYVGTYQAKTRKSASLNDIAKAAGLAQSTVSRALNNYPDISEKTRAYVNQIAQQLNYSPSSRARRLARGTNETVGYILPADSSAQSEPFLAEIITGLSQAFAQQDWDLIVTSPSSSDQELDTYRRLIEADKVSGMVVTRTKIDDPRIDLLQDYGFPFVAHGRTADSSGYSYLDVDNEAAFHTAVERLIELGHRQIAKIAAPPRYNFTKYRIRGYQSALTKAGVESRDDFLIHAELSIDAGRQAMVELLCRDPRPTAVVCANDIIAIGAMHAISAAGLAVGEDISVIGYDGLPAAELVLPALATMGQSARASGERLAQMLLKLLDHQFDGRPIQEVWQAELIERASIGPPPSAL